MTTITEHPASIKLRKWSPFRNTAGMMLAFFSIELPSGLIINDLKLMIGPQGRRWIAMPAKQRERGDSNRPIWDDYIEFGNKPTRNRFQDLVIEVVRREHPKAFAEEPSP